MRPNVIERHSVLRLIVRDGFSAWLKPDLKRGLACLFALVLGGPSLGATQHDTATVAFITNREGPHLDEYLAALAETPEVERVFFVDDDAARVARARTKLGTKLAGTYVSTAQLFAEQNPLMALISLEPRLAASAVAEAIEAGCHVLAEKPAFLKASDLAALKRRADERGLLLMLALGNRTNPESQLARELIRQNKLGQIYGVELHLVADQARLRTQDYQQSWFAQKTRSGGGHLTWLGLHWVDLAMYVTGADVIEVAGFTTNVGGQPIDVEDSAVLSLKFDQGFLGTMTSGYYLEKGYHSHLKIWGARGWIEINLHGGESPMRYYSSSEDSPAIKTFRRPESQAAAYTPFLKACVRAALGREEPPVTSRDSWRILETIHAAYEAAASGRSVRIQLW